MPIITYNKELKMHLYAYIHLSTDTCIRIYTLAYISEIYHIYAHTFFTDTNTTVLTLVLFKSMHACVCVFVCTSIRTYLCISIYILHIYMCVYACVHVDILYLSTYLPIYKYYVYIYTCICIHIAVYIYIHIHI